MEKGRGTPLPSALHTSFANRVLFSVLSHVIMIAFVFPSSTCPLCMNCDRESNPLPRVSFLSPPFSPSPADSAPMFEFGIDCCASLPPCLSSFQCKMYSKISPSRRLVHVRLGRRHGLRRRARRPGVECAPSLRVPACVCFRESETVRVRSDASPKRCES